MLAIVTNTSPKRHKRIKKDRDCMGVYVKREREKEREREALYLLTGEYSYVDFIPECDY